MGGGFIGFDGSRLPGRALSADAQIPLPPARSPAGSLQSEPLARERPHPMYDGGDDDGNGNGNGNGRLGGGRGGGSPTSVRSMDDAVNTGMRKGGDHMYQDRAERASSRHGAKLRQIMEEWGVTDVQTAEALLRRRERSQQQQQGGEKRVDPQVKFKRLMRKVHHTNDQEGRGGGRQRTTPTTVTSSGSMTSRSTASVSSTSSASHGHTAGHGGAGGGRGGGRPRAQPPPKPVYGRNAQDRMNRRRGAGRAVRTGGVRPANNGASGVNGAANGGGLERRRRKEPSKPAPAREAAGRGRQGQRRSGGGGGGLGDAFDGGGDGRGGQGQRAESSGSIDFGMGGPSTPQGSLPPAIRMPHMGGQGMGGVTAYDEDVAGWNNTPKRADQQDRHDRGGARESTTLPQISPSIGWGD